MKILLIGSGGREHALAWAISASPLLDHLYACPGNPGIAEHADIVNINPNDHAGIIRFSTENAIDLVVVGPEAPLCAGLIDDLLATGIKAFGPTKAAAQLEGSKSFTKRLASANNIPTAGYMSFSDHDSALAYIQERPYPMVVKADGLAAGKGVTICTSHIEAFTAVNDIFAGVFSSDSSVVIEDFLVGEEASFFVLSDGANVLPLASAQDHKRVFDGDKGPNTGGMGAYSPAPVMTDKMIDQVMDRIITPTIAAMARANAPFCGVLYAGLMITDDGPQLIEYNVRFGDPETQVLMMRLKSDLLPALMATVDGDLKHFHLSWHDDAALTVVMASDGYPNSYQSGQPINGLDEAGKLGDVKIFHAGTAHRDGEIISAGGRVLNITAKAPNIAEAQALAYQAVDLIDWPGGFCRRDIGWRTIS